MKTNNIMKIQAIITDDGKMYKQVPSSVKEECDICPYNLENISCLADESICTDGYNWQEVPKITEKQIMVAAEHYQAVASIFYKGANWYKQQLKQRLEE